jgi:hypothetical protein
MHEVGQASRFSGTPLAIRSAVGELVHACAGDENPDISTLEEDVRCVTDSIESGRAGGPAGEDLANDLAVMVVRLLDVVDYFDLHSEFGNQMVKLVAVHSPVDLL